MNKPNQKFEDAIAKLLSLQAKREKENIKTKTFDSELYLEYHESPEDLCKRYCDYGRERF